MSGYFTASWSDFSVAVVGASAALTGLLVVAVSINIERILAIDALTVRSLSTMVLFIVPLVIGMLLLVPEQPRTALGVELMITGTAAGAGLLRINRPGNRGSWPTTSPTSCPLLRIVHSGVTVLGRGRRGIQPARPGGYPETRKHDPEAAGHRSRDSQHGLTVPLPELGHPRDASQHQ
jgi:hypothetical protein